MKATKNYSVYSYHGNKARYYIHGLICHIYTHALTQHDSKPFDALYMRQIKMKVEAQIKVHCLITDAQSQQAGASLLAHALTIKSDQFL